MCTLQKMLMKNLQLNLVDYYNLYRKQPMLRNAALISGL